MRMFHIIDWLLFHLDDFTTNEWKTEPILMPALETTASALTTVGQFVVLKGEGCS
jgi:hypothetical protein